MDKRSIKLLSIPALVCTLLASAALVFSSKAPNNTLANEMMASNDPYTLRVDGLSTSNKVLQTQNGNNINFAVYKYNNNTFASNGAYICNTTPISGLKSISIRSVSRADYEIDYGWSTTFESRGYVPGSLNVNYNFNDENPSYFRIRCLYGPLEITSITVTYSCVETPKPDIYEFTYAKSVYDSGYAIAGYNGTSTSVVIPTHYHGVMITTINSRAFLYSSIRSITMPETILYIGDSAFYFCNYLQEVNLSQWLVSIGNHAFEGCSSLTSISMPDTVSSIGESAFEHCENLESIRISNYLETLGDYAFSCCNSLTSLVLPQTLPSIGNHTLSGCIALEELTIPFIGGSKTENQYLSYIFGGSSYSDNATKVPSTLKTLTIDARFPTIGERALYQCPMENIIFVDSYIDTIGAFAFSKCTSLKSIIIPDGVETIGNNVFTGCSSLTEVYIPSSVQSIGSSILSGGCSKLEKVSLPFVGSNREDSTNKRINYWTFNNGAPSTLHIITLLEGCTHLYDYAFEELRYVTTIYLPDSLTSVSSYALKSNFVTTVHINYSASVYVLSYLRDVYLLSDVYIHLDTNEHFFNVVNKMYLYYLSEENVHYIHDNGEEYTHIDVVDGMKNISQYCFANCTSIVSISLPHSLTMLKGACAFFRCTSLETITYDGTVEEWNALERVSSWNSGAPDIMVTCTNGSVSLLA